MEYIYNYHPEYKNYVGFGEAFESPLEPGIYIVPAHATKIPPPLVKDGEVQIFNEQTNQWEVCEDQRGTWYHTEKVIEFEHFDPKTPPVNATRKKPPINHIPDLVYHSESDEWEIDVHYTEGDYPVSNIFPEILPYPEVKYEPQYSEELGRWTFVIRDEDDVPSESSNKYQPVVDRLKSLGIDYDLFRESLQSDSQQSESNSELENLHKKLSDLGLNIELLRSLLIVPKNDDTLAPDAE